MIQTINKDRVKNESTQVQYTYINFDYMLKKIRIDLIFNKIKENYEYLKFFAKEKYVLCSHLFVAKMIDSC
jgi:hypothetical protein